MRTSALQKKKKKKKASAWTKLSQRRVKSRSGSRGSKKEKGRYLRRLADRKGRENSSGATSTNRKTGQKCGQNHMPKKKKNPSSQERKKRGKKGNRRRVALTKIGRRKEKRGGSPSTLTSGRPVEKRRGEGNSRNGSKGGEEK